MNTNKNRTILEAEGFEVRIDHHPRFMYSRPTKARVYVSGEESVDFTETYALQKENGYGNKGDNPEEDKLFAKLNRQVVKNQKAVIYEAFRAIPDLADLFVPENTFTFSRTAGCGCGCSPAFVPKAGVQHDGLWVESIFITKKSA